MSSLHNLVHCFNIYRAILSCSGILWVYSIYHFGQVFNIMNSKWLGSENWRYCRSIGTSEIRFLNVHLLILFFFLFFINDLLLLLTKSFMDFLIRILWSFIVIQIDEGWFNQRVTKFKVLNLLEDMNKIHFSIEMWHSFR